MHDWLITAAAWWAGTALGGGAVLLAGCGLMRITRDPSSRQRVGEIAVVAALLVAVLRLGPTWLALPWPASAAHAAEPASTSTLSSELSGWVVLTPTPEIGAEPPAASRTPDAAAKPPEPSWDWSTVATALTGGYLAIAALLFLRWLLGQWALARLRQQARPASARARSLFAMMAGGALWPRPRLGLTERLRLPVAFGLRRPAVLLPDAFDAQADDTTLRWVFAHELTHLRRRDPWSYWAVGLAQAVYFYLPWFWWLKRQVRLCQEYVADAAAAREGAAADDYAEFLVRLAKAPAAPLGAAGLGSSSDLFRRVHMLLQSSSRGPSSGSSSSARLSALGLLAAAVLASGFGVRADTPKPEPVKPVIEDVIITLDELPVVSAQEVVLRLLDDELQEKKDEKQKDKDKPDKKRVIVIQQDGKNILTIPADANVEDVKKMVEKAMMEAKKQAASARKHDEEAKEEVKRAVEKARRAADEARKAGDEARRAAEAERKAVREKMTQEREKAQEEGRKAADAARKAVEAERKAREKGQKDKIQSGDAERKAELEKAQTKVRAIARRGDSRLGLRVEKPSAAMIDQLNLSKETGLVVVEVADDSAAAKAGFKANDILVELGGQAVPSDAGAFLKQVREMKGDEPVNAVVVRKGRKERIRGIKLGEAKSGGDVFQFTPGKGVFQFKDGKGEFNFEGFKGFDPAQLKDLELKLEKLPEMRLDLKLDGVNLDGKKLSEDIRKQIELKMEPLKKQLDPQKLQDLQRQIELKIEPLRQLEKINVDDLKKHIDVIVAPQMKNLEDLHKKMRVHVSPDGSDKSGEKKNVSVSVTVNDGEFKAVQKEDKLEITVTGSADGEKVKVREIRIYADGEKTAYKSLDDVPDKFRDKVKRLIANREGSPVRFRFERDEQ